MNSKRLFQKESVFPVKYYAIYYICESTSIFEKRTCRKNFSGAKFRRNY